MPMVSSQDQVKREDLSKLYINADVRETPFLSRLRSGDALTNSVLFSWAIERFEDGRDNTLLPGVSEGQDASSFETDKQDRLYGRPQKFWRKPFVTTESNEINEAPADFGRYDQQVVKKTTEQKRNMEKRLFSDADSRDDDGVRGRECMGAGRFVNDTVSVGSSGAALTFGDTQTTVPSQYLTPTAQIYVGNLNAKDASGNEKLIFDNDALNAMLQNRYDALGRTNELSGFVDPLLKVHLSKLERYQKNMVNFTPVTRTPQEAIVTKMYLLYGADLLETDFGPIDINMVSWMPRTSTGALSGRGYFLDMEWMFWRKSGRYLTHQMLPDGGAGPRGLIQTIAGPQWGHPQAHLKVDPNVVTGTF